MKQEPYLWTADNKVKVDILKNGIKISTITLDGIPDAYGNLYETMVFPSPSGCRHLDVKRYPTEQKALIGLGG